MSISTLIELKELDNSGNKRQKELENGFYDVLLQQPVILEKGDSLAVQKGFLDTIASSNGKIQVNGDENFKISYYLGVQAFEPQGKIFNGQKASTNAAYPIDNQLYFPCEENAATQHYNAVNCQSITFTGKSDQSYRGKGVNYTLEYRDENNNPMANDFRIDNFTRPTPSITMPINKIGQAGTFVISKWGGISGIAAKSHCTNYKVNEVAWNPTGGNTLTPITFNYTFNLPAAEYEAGHLCELLTEEMTNLDNQVTTGSDRAVQNAFCKSTDQINALAKTFTNQGQTRYTNQQGTDVLQFPNTQTFDAEIVPGYGTAADPDVYQNLIGTDQFSFSFDAGNTNKVMLEQNHSNIFSQGSGGTPGAVNETEDGDHITKSVPVKYGGALDFGYNIATRGGAVLIKSLFPSDFWYDKLGLDASICVSAEPTTSTTKGGYSGLNKFAITGQNGDPITDGINVTNSFVSTDAAVKKNSQYYIAEAKKDINAASVANIKIYGKNSLNQITAEQAYFLISIDGFTSNLIGEERLSSSIKSVVSRFYQLESYTSFDSTQDPYIHDGDIPLVISSFKVRILDPYYQPCNVGQDNSIFLNHVRPITNNQLINN